MADGIELRHNTVVKFDDVGTREAIARSVLENGPSTAVALGERLGITPAGIRRHLDLLVPDLTLDAVRALLKFHLRRGDQGGGGFQQA